MTERVIRIRIEQEDIMIGITIIGQTIDKVIGIGTEKLPIKTHISHQKTMIITNVIIIIMITETKNIPRSQAIITGMRLQKRM